MGSLKPSAPRLSWVDALCLASLVATLLVFSYLQSRGRMFWGDEMMGYYVLRAGSLKRAYFLWRTGLDSSGLWFYLLAKPWDLVFGLSESSLRMFSAVCVAAALVLFWATARKLYSLPITAVSAFLIFFDPYVMRWQLSNGRSYGLFLAASALVLYLVILGDEPKRQRPGFSFLALTFFAYSLLAGTHILGGLYAGVFLSAQVASDLWRKQVRPSLYAAAFAGLALVSAISLPNIRSTLAVGKPSFWTLPPVFRSVVFLGPTTWGSVLVIVVVLSAIALVLKPNNPPRKTLYVLFAFFLGLHTFIFILSRIGTSIYVDRYLLPCLLPVGLWCAETLSQICASPGVRDSAKPAVVTIVGALAVLSCRRPSKMPFPTADYTAALLARLPAGVPVIDTDISTFTDVEFYHHGRMPFPFYFPMDDEVTYDPSNQGGVSGFHAMEHFVHTGINAPDLQPTTVLLGRLRTFTVLTGTPATSWFARRVLNRPEYKVEDLGTQTFGNNIVHLWSVHLSR